MTAGDGATRSGTRDIVIERDVDAPSAERDMCEQGWSEMLDRLAGYLPAMAASPR